MIVYRVQAPDGRGPFRPGLTVRWLKRAPEALLLPWQEEFDVQATLRKADRRQPQHIGCGCRTQDQLRRWFSLPEYKALLSLGFQAVELDVHLVLAESRVQLVFQRSLPLEVGARPVALYL